MWLYYSILLVLRFVLVWQVLDSLDAVLDVGGVYDASRDRYDHHQKGFGEVFGHGFNTKLSSAGLVYKVITALTFSKACIWCIFDFQSTFVSKIFFGYASSAVHALSILIMFVLVEFHFGHYIYLDD